MGDLKVDYSRFDAAFERKMQVTPQSLEQALNKAAYYVARKANWFTAKANPQAIKSQLGELVSTTRLTRTGKSVRRRELRLASGSKIDAPLAALIINRRLGEKGLPGLYGRAMEAAIRDLLARRMSSIAFLKSGWLAAIQVLGHQPGVSGGGAPPIDPASKMRSGGMGYAVPAKSGWQMAAEIINTAVSKTDRGLFEKLGYDALQRAVDDEAASFDQYVRDKLAPGDAEFNRAAGH